MKHKGTIYLKFPGWGWPIDSNPEVLGAFSKEKAWYILFHD
jgi:hypothetical protein